VPDLKKNLEDWFDDIPRMELGRMISHHLVELSKHGFHLAYPFLVANLSDFH